MNKGLYDSPGFSETCFAAAVASWFARPVTKFSKFKFLFNPVVLFMVDFGDKSSGFVFD